MAVTKEEYLKAYHEILAKCNSGELMKMSNEERYTILYGFNKTWMEYITTCPQVEKHSQEADIGRIIARARHYMEVDDDGYYYPLNVIYTHPEKIYNGTFKRAKYADASIRSL